MQIHVVSNGGIAAVTTLAVHPLVVANGGGDSLDGVAVFSGHRDGTIRRWNHYYNSPSTEKQIKPPPASSSVWTIVACSDLTQHEVYGTEEQLGIAGLVVRESSHTSSSGQEGDPKSNIDWLLYSWNRQREDMREINGIPQKIMIWQCRSGERYSAIMVDVGRCSTGTFANPLVSCLIFCKLFVEKSPSATKPKGGYTEKSVSSGIGDAAKSEAVPHVESVWEDAILVGLQATCDTAKHVADSPASSSSTAAMPAIVRAAKAPIIATSKTGNLVPYYEQSRERMTPWIVPGGNFVRALVSVPESRYVVSVTETTRMGGQPLDGGANVYAKPEETTDGATAIKDQDETGRKELKSGETQAIALWDASRPGTILQVFELYNAASNNWTSIFRGSVKSATLSGYQLLLLSSRGPRNETSLVTVIDLPQKKYIDTETNGLDSVRLHGAYAIDASVASTGCSDLVAVSEESSNSVVFYSIADLSVSLQASESVVLDDVRPHAKSRLSLEPDRDEMPSQSLRCTILTMKDSHILAGFANGAILCAGSSKVETLSRSQADAHFMISCSTTSVGLDGLPCPHLSADANSTPLRNECTIT